MSARYLLLLGVITGFVAGCGESSPPAATLPSPAASTSPAQSAAAPAAADSVLPALPAPSPQSIAARKLDPERIKRGAAVYSTNCASCHGPNGEGTPNWREQGADGRYPPPPLNGSAHDWHHSTATLERMIREGSPGIGGMPAWDGKLTNQEIDDVIVWIKSQWPDEIYDIWYREIEGKQKH